MVMLPHNSTTTSAVNEMSYSGANNYAIHQSYFFVSYALLKLYELINFCGLTEWIFFVVSPMFGIADEVGLIFFLSNIV